MENALKTTSIQKVLSLAVEMTKDIVAEILSSNDEYFQEIAAHSQQHKMSIIKKIVFSFISLKAKHVCRTKNVSKSTLIRHQKTKEVLFKHQ